MAVSRPSVLSATAERSCAAKLDPVIISGVECTGLFNIAVSGLGQLQADFVLDDEGNEIRAIVTNPGFVLTLEGRKQFK